MGIWTKFATWIGKVGPSPGFVAFNAHCWFAAFMVSWALDAGWSPPLVVFLAVAIPAGKEFWFDLKYETPRQSVLDSVEDFIGYMLGTGVAFAMAILKLI